MNNKEKLRKLIFIGKEIVDEMHEYIKIGTEPKTHWNEIEQWHLDTVNYIKKKHPELLDDIGSLNVGSGPNDWYPELRKSLKVLSFIQTKVSEDPSIDTRGKKIMENSIFVVHGHDELAMTATARLIEQVGLKPIILREQASAGKTIIEKIETYSNVGFGVVIYTPCDEGAIKDEVLRPRARQNVVFEHGFLIGKLGRPNVCALVKDNVEPPNDISGIVYINMAKNGAWRFELATEMKNSGYDIDMNAIP